MNPALPNRPFFALLALLRLTALCPLTMFPEGGKACQPRPVPSTTPCSNFSAKSLPLALQASTDWPGMRNRHACSHERREPRISRLLRSAYGFSSPYDCR